jgi:hypothetical protein
MGEYVIQGSLGVLVDDFTVYIEIVFVYSQIYSANFHIYDFIASDYILLLFLLVIIFTNFLTMVLKSLYQGSDDIIKLNSDVIPKVDHRLELSY